MYVWGVIGGQKKVFDLKVGVTGRMGPGNLELHVVQASL